MEKSTIIERVRRLLALSTSNNVHEAGNAAALAQRLIAKYQIEQAELDAATLRETPVGVAVLAERKRSIRWIDSLASVLADVNQCKAWFDPRVGVLIAGSHENVTLVRYVLGHLTGEVERLCKLDRPTGVGVRAPWCTAFRLGATLELSNRLREAAQAAKAEAQAEGKGTALLVIDQHIARVNALLPKLSSSRGRRTRVNADGYDKGKAAGRSIPLNAPGRLGGGSGARLTG